MAHFDLTRRGALLDPPPQMPGSGPYYTCLVDMQQVPAFPGDYALYFSTDHENGAGGIWLYICSGSPTVAGNWRSYDVAAAAGAFDHVADRPVANPVFQDNQQGTGHTETPHANVIGGVVYLTYHKNGIEGTQRTLLSTSENGVVFERIHGAQDSVILRYAHGDRPGDGHTGYFRWAANPFPEISHRYVGYALHGGGDDYHSAIWGSDDAVHWQILDVFTPMEGYAMPDPEMILIWHELDPASITSLGNGEFVAICGGGNRASGAVARIVELYQVHLTADGRTLTRQCRKILGVTSDGDDREEVASPTCVEIDGVYHLLYVGTSSSGKVNTVMGATGVLDMTTPASVELPEAQRGRHIVR